MGTSKIINTLFISLENYCVRIMNPASIQSMKIGKNRVHKILKAFKEQEYFNKKKSPYNIRPVHN